MGLNLEFCLGNEKEIVGAVKGNNWHLLDIDAGIVKETADLSFHLTHTDLDLLSKQMGIYSKQEPLEFMPYLDDVFQDKDRGVACIDRKWIKHAAQVQDEMWGNIARDWYAAMRTAHLDEQIQVTDSAIRAVHELGGLCQCANRFWNMRSRVLLVWSF